MKNLLILLVLIGINSMALNGIELGDLERLRKAFISGDFTQIKKVSGFSKDIISSGVFSLKDKTLFWEIQKPISQVIKINQDGVFVLENHQWIKQDKAYDKGLFLDIVELRFSNLEKNFSISVSGESNQWYIELMPKNVLIKKIFKRIVIRGEEVVKEIELIETNNDSTRNIFSSVVTK